MLKDPMKDSPNDELDDDDKDLPDEEEEDEDEEDEDDDFEFSPDLTHIKDEEA